MDTDGLAATGERCRKMRAVPQQANCPAGAHLLNLLKLSTHGSHHFTGNARTQAAQQGHELLLLLQQYLPDL